MIHLSHISKQFAGVEVLRDISLRIGEGERVAVVGRNGAGKSTLMKIILGVLRPDAGEINRSRSHTAGYLPQGGVVHGGRSVADEAATAFDDLLEMQRRAERIHREINALRDEGGGRAAEIEELAEELGKIQHHLEHREGWSIESKVEEVLLGLGFQMRDMERRAEEFSGGWQMRLALAKLLLREPTVLMLDEPTNHLDVSSLEWLEGYLRAYDGSIILVSHDSRFLDNLALRTVELSRGSATEYKGNFSAYLRGKKIRAEHQRAKYENQQEKIRSTMKFVERFRAKNTKASQVQSRLRMLEKMEHVELEEEEGSISFDFQEPPRAGKVVMQLDGIHKRYGEKEVFAGLDLTLLRGDRVALLGANGTGKSTLARILAGVEPFQEGSRHPGHNVLLSYYAQHQAEELARHRTVIETLEEVSPPGMQQRLRTLLGCFLFRGDDVFKQVGVLSGGERSRLALARMLLMPANLLVLDEPTNHLDLRSKSVLQEALLRFGGAYVIVSHDRDFLEPLVAKVIEFTEGKASVYPGGVKEFLERRTGEKEAEEETGKAGRPRPARLERERKRLEAERRQERSRKVNPLRERLKEKEAAIAELEAQKGGIERDLARDEVYADGARARTLSHEYEKCSRALEELYGAWTRLQEELEEEERRLAEEESSLGRQR
jgi:ATP-binding cassette subfamily F protein 3